MDREPALEPSISAQQQVDDRDGAFTALAARQHGLAKRRQLMALGFGRHEIAHLRKRRRMRLAHRGVYAVGPRRLTRAGRWMAAVLAVGPDAVVSHRSAGALWGMIGRDGGDVEVSVHRELRDRAGICIHLADLPPDEITVIDAIPVTTAARTLLDLAAVLTRPQLERALHEADIRRLWDVTGLHALLDRYPTRPGTPLLREILADHATVSKPEFVRRFLAFLMDHDLPRPLVSRLIPDIGECDFVWPDARLIVELDGYATHGTRAQFERDRARDRAAQVAGWRVIRITWRQLRDEAGQLAADLRRLLDGPH
jgi:hypothetical protein